MALDFTGAYKDYSSECVGFDCYRILIFYSTNVYLKSKLSIASV